ncbi:DUF2000 domain-containing protein [Cellulomonas sp. URHE0023]|uniref:DUF2000 domain-containing protein n=1 Tax=Cellulomonas sp. URHE0023 TaxID=1380354 RepID=UPI0004876A64|nr:DUF2000 domain-containing protein [Cellulomonas sp. URHE0023]
MTVDVTQRIGFAPDEIETGAHTRAARLKWVVVVDASLPAGRAANAVACVTAATAAGVDGLLGPGVRDRSGTDHPGIPWIGCTVLAADAAQLTDIRAKAASYAEMYVADMPEIAQSIRVYDEYVDHVTDAEDLPYIALSLVGPRSQVDRLVRKLPLLS